MVVKIFLAGFLDKLTFKQFCLKFSKNIFNRVYPIRFLKVICPIMPDCSHCLYPFSASNITKSGDLICPMQCYFFKQKIQKCIAKLRRVICHSLKKRNFLVNNIDVFKKAIYIFTKMSWNFVKLLFASLKSSLEIIMDFIDGPAR